jgi:pyruvate,water dikinase
MLFSIEPGVDEQSLPSVEMVGGKGYGLHWLATNGFSPPTTWVLGTAAYDLVVEQAGLVDAIAKIERTITDVEGDWGQAQQALEALEPQRTEVFEGLRQASIPDLLVQAMEPLVLRRTQWAIRSSATVEDNSLYSFAGQFRSWLSVPAGGAMWGVVRRVWASTFGVEPLTYCAQKATPLPRMAVILQPMKPMTARDRSGVAFSDSPVPAFPGVLIQATFGAGQVVVDGYGGDLYGVQEGRVQIQPMPPDQIRVTEPRGFMTPSSLPSGLAFTENEARELAALVLEVAAKWGGPVNVEFVWRADEAPQLVQVRSMTDY